jgi:hypothetical protein
MEIQKLKLFFIAMITFAGTIHSNNNEFDHPEILTVHKTPTCGCCKMWIRHAENNGFKAMIQDHQNLAKIQDSYNIKPKYRSCHTSVSKSGHIFEGHVPSKYVSKFLSENHPNAIGLAVPGMPLGAPGMEFDDQFTPFNVLILFKDGTSEVYAKVR